MTTDFSFSPPTRVGLVLGAGGEMGGAYIRAALAALEESTGWHAGRTSTIVGTSAGALNGARLPDESDEPRPEAIAALARLSGGLAPPAARATDSLVHFSRRTAGRLIALLAPNPSRVASYEVARPPYHPGVNVVTVRRRSGRRVVHNLAHSPDPSAALYASAAVPGAVRPVEVAGAQHIDGAVWSPTNADLVSPDDHDVLVVIAPMVARSGGKAVARSHRVLLVREIATWHRAEKPVLVVAPAMTDESARQSSAEFAAAARYAIEKATPAVD